MKNLIRIIGQRVQLDEEDIDLCAQYFEAMSAVRNTVLEEQNKIPQNLYFINKGFIRLCYNNSDGKDVTTHICTDNSFVTSFLSFIHSEKSKVRVECITDCELARISKTNLQTLIAKSGKFREFSLIIFEESIKGTESRADDLATLTGEQRYKKLLQTAPSIVQNVPIQYIASFLGIQPESLSRIRRQMIN